MEKIEKERKWLIEYEITIDSKTEDDWFVISAPDFWHAVNDADKEILRKVSFTAIMHNKAQYDIWSISEVEE